ncbi:hypothetical protein [Sulfurisphaera tokodaii]|uniref:Uncharacterized protein n=2 Tax=Sulfurisphaera tokodaii TaxID=111955 RepID=Q973H1_SULTO|nr:hypothetical protein [Sulfurisphaera tokodaii]BAB65942.1 hypothetical protein STK_09300 [Sulfurisphaera tokodaii str. 7]HII73902.1 hypothetical protein [Sulfurisphaera tokodaii]
MRKVIDSLTFYGIKLYSYVKDLKLEYEDFIIEKIILNPLYKYSCQCCVDGFYQQYLWSKGRDYVIRLGIYNPKCRVPPQIELERQYDHEIHGIMLHPKHHGFSLLDKRLEFVYMFAEDHELPLIIHSPDESELRKILEFVSTNIIIVSNTDININSSKIFYIREKPTKENEIYGSGSPYTKDIIESLKINSSFYNQETFYFLAKKLFNKN